MTENIETTLPYNKGVDIPQSESTDVWKFIVGKGRAYLKDTAFVTGEEFTQKDIDLLKEYYQEVFDYQEQKFGPDGAVFNKSLRDHLLLADRIAIKAAPLLEINPYELEAAALTHDLGRLFSHRRGRNNAIERSLSEKIGFNRKFTDLLPSDTLWTEIDEDSLKERLKNITSENGGIVGMIELIDVFAKWEDKSKSTMRNWKSVISSSRGAQHQPEKSKMWPSEFKRQGKITSEEGNQAIATKYEYLKDWFERKTGIQIDDFIGQVENSLAQEPLKGSWA